MIFPSAPGQARGAQPYAQTISGTGRHDFT